MTIMLKAEGDFGLYQAPADRVAKVRRQYDWADDDHFRSLVEERAGHECPWPRPVLEIMWAEWEVGL